MASLLINGISAPPQAQYSFASYYVEAVQCYVHCGSFVVVLVNMEDTDDEKQPISLRILSPLEETTDDGEEEMDDDPSQAFRGQVCAVLKRPPSHDPKHVLLDGVQELYLSEEVIIFRDDDIVELAFLFHPSIILSQGIAAHGITNVFICRFLFLG